MNESSFNNFLSDGRLPIGKILVACEESQAVTIELRKLGYEAFSCDMIECSGGHPEWHIQGDAIKEAYSGKYEMMIGFPPCTYLSYVGNRWFRPEYNIQVDLFDGHVTRHDKRKEGYDFFMQLINAPIKYIAIENPVGIVQKWYRKPDQRIHPYFFGDKFKKRTCLWLKNLPKLEPTEMLPEPKPLYYLKTTGKPIQWCESLGRSKDRAKVRSKTFPGIAKAMADQWTRKSEKGEEKIIKTELETETLGDTGT